MQEYPKMLYREGSVGDCVVVEGVSFETLIVDSEYAEIAAEGFAPTATKAEPKPKAK